MLVLSRKLNERVFVSFNENGIVGGEMPTMTSKSLDPEKTLIITVTKISKNEVRLGFSAPNNYMILREELLSNPENKSFSDSPTTITSDETLNAKT